jgi:hypothetical protein
VPSSPQPQIVYVPAPQPVYAPAPDPTPAPPPQTGGGTNPPPAPTPEEQQAEARTQSLLTRDRSRFGTVTTSFRGLLGLATGGNTQPKTLLGE